MPELPRATYRLQLHAGFTLDDASAVVPYLARLGVSHVYLSPISTARPGSTHGYDVVDHAHINPEIGGEPAWQRFVAAAQGAGLGVVVDIVPNHVGVGGSRNREWLDVLEWGAASPHATMFDIRWYSQRAGLAGQVLVPMLGRQYGEALEAGELELRFDAQEGSLSVWLPGDHRLPIRPEDYGLVLGNALPSLRERFQAQREPGPAAREAAQALKAALAEAANSPEVAGRIAARLRRMNGRPGRPDSFDALDRLIQRQHWRAASYRVAADDINYRRFFNINDLAGVRVEDEAVFDALHRAVIERCHRGEIDGLRIDHIDGLYDPAAYCRRLRERLPEGCYVVVEKILAAHEALPDWPIEGTTGYDFAAQATQLFVDDAAERTFTRIYEDFTGETTPFESLVTDCKRLVMRRELASELAVLARIALHLAQENRRSRDFTQATLAETLREIVAFFPVYRSYVSEQGASESDVRYIDWAVGRARRCLPDVDESVFEFLSGLMQGRIGGATTPAALNFAQRLQQYTGPVMAKGMEDTAFYRHHRLLALNEVGGHPGNFGLAASAFHQDMARRAKSWPAAMLAGTTHDTKRGEDARARLVALTGFGADWEQQVRVASRVIRARRGSVEVEAPPDANDEYGLLQTLVGAWPEEFLETAPAADDARWTTFIERVQAAAQKAVREAKRHSTWNRPDESYEGALSAWIAAALDVSRPNPFIERFRPFVRDVARLGREVTLAQTLLRLTAPGVPDLYQGSECGDYSLVDPDNRRPVDFGANARQLEAQSHPKQRLVARLLALRREKPALFAPGSAYEPLRIEGPAAGGLLAFERRAGKDALRVMIVTRPARLESRGDWGDTRIVDDAGSWRDVMSGERRSAGLPLAEALAECGAAAWVIEEQVAVGRG